MNDKQEIFLILFEPIKEKLWRFCLSLTGSYQDAKDLLQDTIEIAYKNFHLLKHKEAFLSYLFTIASRNAKIARRRYSKFNETNTMFLESLESRDVSPEIKTDISALYEALDRLPYKQKEAVLLYDIMGFSRKETGEIQGIGLETLKARLYRGRKKLAILLGVKDDTVNSVNNKFSILNQDFLK